MVQSHAIVPSVKDINKIVDATAMQFIMYLKYLKQKKRALSAETEYSIKYIFIVII